MGVFVPALNAANIAMHFTDPNGDDQVNSFWVKNSAAWTGADMDTMLAAFHTWFDTGNGVQSYVKLMSHHCALNAITGRDMTTQHGLSHVYQTGLPDAGLAIVNAIEAGCTKAITSRTGLAGKSYRGRTFLIGVDVTKVATPEIGTIDATYCANAVLAFNSLITAVPAAVATCTLVVCSRFYQPGGPHTATLPRATAVLTPITSFGFHDLNVDFQRRRAPGHGRHN